MKKHELEAAIKAAQAELERLQAIEPEPDPHPMTLPLERVRRGVRYGQIATLGDAQQLTEFRDPMDAALWKVGNYYATREQAEAYADAFEVLRLIRRQPGIVDPSSGKEVHRPTARDNLIIVDWYRRPCATSCMFPCFESHDAAQAAVDAVGAERLIKTAKWLAGVVE